MCCSGDNESDLPFGLLSSKISKLDEDDDDDDESDGPIAGSSIEGFSRSFRPPQYSLPYDRTYPAVNTSDEHTSTSPCNDDKDDENIESSIDGYKSITPGGRRGVGTVESSTGEDGHDGLL